MLLQRFREVVRPYLKIVEQTHGLDRDDRLIGESADQIDMALREWPDILPPK